MVDVKITSLQGYFPDENFFLLTRNENRLTQKDFLSGNEQNTGKARQVELSYCTIGRIRRSRDNDDICTAPIRVGKDVLEFVRSSKNIIAADFDDEN
ncbi:hypothetical protein TNCV_4798401 [Trichonephila clavipes]|nr:hypothetical protein TNCV_4798401 [Trichonephila clavipes]